VWSGYDVLVADHPERALAACHERHPALLLIDIMLPQMSGIELAQTLRGQGYAETPLIGMSASRLMREMAADSALFTAVISKPFELTALLSLLRRHLGNALEEPAHP
jgi:two-component system sensor histidine kinase/response regulator